jgi:hypothetical protein
MDLTRTEKIDFDGYTKRWISLLGEGRNQGRRLGSLLPVRQEIAALIS